MIVAAGASACSTGPASGDGAASAGTASGGASPSARGGVESGGNVSGGAGGDDGGGAPDRCDLDAFARDFTTALAKSTAPSGCAIPMNGGPIGMDRPISSAALDFVASTKAESADAFAFTLESCDTPNFATCANVFDKFAGAAGGNLQLLAHPFSETIERCSDKVELSVWSMTKGMMNGATYCLMGDRGGQAMGYCVFGDAVSCAAKRP